jgi:hypothetical protein
VDYAVRFAGILALTAGTAVLATEDPSSIAEADGDRQGAIENLTRDDDVPVGSTQGRTLDLMLIVWTLKTTSSDTK